MIASLMNRRGPRARKIMRMKPRICKATSKTIIPAMPNRMTNGISVPKQRVIMPG